MFDSRVLTENASDWFAISENVARKGNSDVGRGVFVRSLRERRVCLGREKKQVPGAGRYVVSDGANATRNGWWEGGEKSIREEQLSTATKRGNFLCLGDIYISL